MKQGNIFDSGYLTYSGYSYLITLSNLGFVNNKLGNFSESEKYYLRAIDFVKNDNFISSNKELYSNYPKLVNNIYSDVYANIFK